MSLFLTIFFTVFFAELGDKSQLATVLYATNEHNNRWVVFGAAVSGMLACTLLAVGLGVAAERWLAALPLKLLAGLGFIAIGGTLIFEHFKG